MFLNLVKITAKVTTRTTNTTHWRISQQSKEASVRQLHPLKTFFTLGGYPTVKNEAQLMGTLFDAEPVVENWGAIRQTLYFFVWNPDAHARLEQALTQLILLLWRYQVTGFSE